jgi:hypothetical protein
MKKIKCSHIAECSEASMSKRSRIQEIIKTSAEINHLGKNESNKKNKKPQELVQEKNQQDTQTLRKIKKKKTKTHYPNKQYQK